MLTSKVTCPQCQASLKFLAAPKPGKSIRCPTCALKFLPPEPPAGATDSRAPGAQDRRLLVLIAALALIGVGGIVAFQSGLFTDNADSVTADASSTGQAQPKAQEAEVPAEPPPGEFEFDKQAPVAAATPANAVPPELTANPKKTPQPIVYAELKRPSKLSTVPALNLSGVNAHPQQEKINAAIASAVDYLQKSQNKAGGWAGPNDYRVGYAALGGLTLLEGGVAPDHPSVQKVADFVRATGISNHRVYQVSLAILFLSRLNDPRDEILIQVLALQLIAGQGQNGGWGYECPTLTNQQTQQLLTSLRANAAKLGLPLPKGTPRELKTPLPKDTKAETKTPSRNPGNSARKGDPGAKNDQAKGEAPKGPSPAPFNDAPILNMPAGPNHPLLDIPELRILVTREDNSNTQFALLALWAARRHSVPADASILTAARRLVAMQNEDGGWFYEANFGRHTKPSMTCVGLLGLAMGHGLTAPITQKNAAPLPADPRIDKGLKSLGAALYTSNLRNLYFLWSLERVGMLYNLPTIGNKDWYDLGVRELLPAQEQDGRWNMGGYPQNSALCDTCFAVLFLKRSNLVRDLSESLPLFIAISDPEKRNKE